MTTYNQIVMARNDKPLLVMDIDETLLYASVQPLPYAHDYKAERTWVYKRPYVESFLNYCNVNFHIGIWTSARASYAQEIVEQVFGFLKPKFIYSEEHCQYRKNLDGKWISLKPLEHLTELGFKINNILMIDDTPEKHVLNPDNLIPVPPYYGDGCDEVLPKLEIFLDQIKSHHDFYSLNKSDWYVGKYVK